MMDQTLITIDEVRNLGRKLSKNIDTLKFNDFALEAQRNYFEPLIGSALYCDLQDNTTIQNGGLLDIGKEYTIIQFNDGDDFTNVGAVNNEYGEKFTATGTTPTSWINGSILQNTSTIYDELLNGKKYTNSNNTLINFRGSKLYLIYHFLYLYTKEGDYQYSDEGGKQYGTENTKNAETNFNRDIIYQHKKNADNFGKTILTFLEDNKTSYPLYDSNEIEPKAVQAIDFTVVGETFTRSRIIQ